MEIVVKFGRARTTAQEERQREREREEVERRLAKIEAEVRLLMRRAGIKPETPVKPGAHVRAVNE